MVTTTKYTKHTKKMQQNEILFKEESYRVMGACFEVCKEMGCGFLEPVYQECLEMEFARRASRFDRRRGLACGTKECL
jgi:hypothetical protein